MERQFTQFLRTKAGWPRIITAAVMAPEERAGRPYLVLATLPYKAREDGFPNDGELNRVCRVEDQITSKLEAEGGIYLGHITGEGSMVAVHYLPKSAPDSVLVKTGLLKRDVIVLESRLDPEWSWHSGEMVPTAIEEEMSLNTQLLGKLREVGDDHSKERPVDFGAFFPSKGQLDAFVEAVAPQGFKLNAEGAWTAGDNNPGCELVHFTSIEAETIAGHCAYLRQQARLHGGDLDGWASPVAK